MHADNDNGYRRLEFQYLAQHTLESLRLPVSIDAKFNKHESWRTRRQGMGAELAVQAVLKKSRAGSRKRAVVMKHHALCTS